LLAGLRRLICRSTVFACLLWPVCSVWGGPALPVISIVIDDIGYRHVDDRQALTLPGPVAFAIMPHSPHALEMSELAGKSGKDVILHMPMEAIEEDNNRFLGPGALRHDMNEAQFISTLIYNLRSVPNIIGVNNHMGSLISADQERMGWLMSYLDVRNIFYLDSMTTDQSVAAKAAREENVPYLRRDVFLDNSTRPEDIDNQFDELIAIAKRKGTAIAIGHPHPETIRALAAKLEKLDEYGVRLIGVKEMMLHQLSASLTRVSLDNGTYSR
jgi:polysaccharide deacetylase 2 family uncharacterized protein YibQ